MNPNESKNYSDETESSDLLINNLIYVSPEPLSLAVNRTQVRNYFQRNQYNAEETAICILNSGTEYIDPCNSYLTFDVKLTGTTENFVGSFGTGSAMNLIRSIVIRSRSGTEIDRIQNLNIWSRIKTLNTESMAYLETTGSTEGWLPEYIKVPSIANESGFLSGDVYVNFVIPLKRLSSFFEPIKQCQLPAAIMSGMQIELVFEDVRTAIKANPSVSPTAQCTGYTINNISFLMDSCALTDDTQKTLNSISASQGLELSYPRVYTSINDVSSTSNTVSAQVRKAVSNCSYAVAVAIDPTKFRDIREDSFKCGTSDYSSYQWRIGSLFFPNQPLTLRTNNARAQSESFILSKACFNKLKNEHMESAISYSIYYSVAGAICSNFERNQALEVCGVPINNSRVLEFEATYTVAENRQLYIFMVYNAISRSYLDNTSVGI